ncbi:hypothetical protein [Streptomyces sp. SHP 1-2]|uniref:hypothetical protein n=1 Tax=Streptomyces sp. SHP 1-2 TaxID=2769489 RepID=UPI0022374A84|nr:hypothetical protein [Streptomyces sp. SHP 1-2]MCW5254011.1 hypothetical protein [Streptomyces sp. SHP 1-2]
MSGAHLPPPGTLEQPRSTRRSLSRPPRDEPGLPARGGLPARRGPRHRPVSRAHHAVRAEPRPQDEYQDEHQRSEESRP